MIEAGREFVGKGGIVRNEAAQLAAVEKVKTSLLNLGCTQTTNHRIAQSSARKGIENSCFVEPSSKPCARVKSRKPSEYNPGLVFFFFFFFFFFSTFARSVNWIALCQYCRAAGRASSLSDISLIQRQTIINDSCGRRFSHLWIFPVTTRTEAPACKRRLRMSIGNSWFYLWAAYNRYLAHVIAHLPASKLETACRIGSGEAVSLSFLATDYLLYCCTTWTK